MHAGEVVIDASLVRRLLETQFPSLAHLAIERVDSFGTDHAIFRLGAELSLRLPRIAWAERQAELEARWLPVLAPRLPLAVPEPVGTGRPEHGYPFEWSVTTWLSGSDAGVGAPEPLQAAHDLARFITALRFVPTSGAPVHDQTSRGGELLGDQPADRRPGAARGGCRARRLLSSLEPRPLWSCQRNEKDADSLETAS